MPNDDELLTADAILNHAGSGPKKRVPVPAWGGSLLVRGMTVREFELNQAARKADDGTANASLIQKCAVTESGARLFQKEHIGRIAELGVREIDPIVEAILTLSGLNDEGEAEVLGKSETTPTSGPSTESPTTSDASSRATEDSANG